jgi:hypothetical protein
MHKGPQHNSDPSLSATETVTAQDRAYTPDFDGAGSISSDFDDEPLIDSSGRRRVNPNIVECIQPSFQCLRELMSLLPFNSCCSRCGGISHLRAHCFI